MKYLLQNQPVQYVRKLFVKRGAKIISTAKKYCCYYPYFLCKTGHAGKTSSVGAQFYANAGGVINTDDLFIATERKKQSKDIIVVQAKGKDDYEHYSALADKANKRID